MDILNLHLKACDKISECTNNTEYIEDQISSMKNVALYILVVLAKLKDTVQIVHDTEKNEITKTIKIRFDEIKFSHHYIIIYASFGVYRWLKIHLNDPKNKFMFPTITTNGYGTAIVIDYEAWKEFTINLK